MNGSLYTNPVCHDALGDPFVLKHNGCWYAYGTQADGRGGIPVRWKGPYAINGALTHLMGSHSRKVGADLRRLGVALSTADECPNDVPALGGCFRFDNRFTSRNGVGGNEIASLLMGLPYAGSAPANPGSGACTIAR